MNLDVLAGAVAHRIVPVVEIDDVAHAVPLAGALAAGGLPLMEITMRTPAALPAIAAVAEALPDFIVGAGTILTSRNMRDAAAAGARFAVSPGFTAALSKAADELALPFIPGAATPSEILVAAAAGHRLLKFFPAEQLGGIGLLRALAAPFASLGVAFMPTGGVRADTARDYLALPNVAVVGGTWIAPRAGVVAGHYDRIQAAAHAARTALDSQETP